MIEPKRQNPDQLEAIERRTWPLAIWTKEQVDTVRSYAGQANEDRKALLGHIAWMQANHSNNDRRD